MYNPFLGTTDKVRYAIEKILNGSSGYSAQYRLKETLNDTVISYPGDIINIPKDMVVQSGTVETCATADTPITGLAVGDKYIDLLLANSDNQHVYISCADLVSGSAVSPYTYLTQAEYEALETSDPDTLYWVTYPLSGDHVVWKNGEATDCRVEKIGFGLGSSGAYRCPYSKFVLTKNSGGTAGMFPYAKAVDVAYGVTSLGEYSFRDCSSLTEISIPNSVTNLGQYCFDGCSYLTEISISNSVTSLGQYCFLECRSLMSINYNGTKSQFTAISKGYGWRADVPTTCIVHCTDGDYPITNFA